ncbi:MAG: putative bifunctional deaminase-reductase-like protein [Amycolatopsis sp.]|jgi:dihydrofolate reductase|uniref:dihydrofolate reductase family protein n=1 Tax=Amycolatopsis sp. TaxID=37632 RepID=UPI00262BAC5D|nr:dihydrofolate reductase family protein [Amycolatopsis sp.]MCU1681054.1 putative bifunctional deaminase-reductase-like protein [Amycolatopsis sp.]
MRKVILSISISLDGYIEGPERQIDWHFVDEELHRYFNDKLRDMGAFLEGRVTYELMAEYWPTDEAVNSADPVVADFSRIWREMPKFLYSTTVERADWNTTIKRAVVVEEVEALKAEPGGDLVVGGADLAAEFRRLDLIDEYHIYVHPILIGRGKPLFEETDFLTKLKLVETRAFGNGVVLLRYERPAS